MRYALCSCAAILFLAGSLVPARAQTAAPGTAQAVSAPGGNEVAASVNGQPIAAMAVERALRGTPPGERARMREDVINLLVDNILVEQYLLQLKVKVDDAAVEKRLEEIRAEAKKDKKDFDEKLKESQLSLEELRTFIRADLRWEAFVSGQVDDAKLKAYFEANKDMFNGSAIKARHILISPPADDAKACSEASAKLAHIKQEIEATVTAGLAKLPADADNLTRAKERERLTDQAFSTQAKKESCCPSKVEGGDLPWFNRAGPMVDAFSKAAYACKPFEMTEPVKTQFGYHLILVTQHKAGNEATKFEDAKEAVKNVYGEKLREAVVAMMRPRAKIQITPYKP